MIDRIVLIVGYVFLTLLVIAAVLYAVCTLLDFVEKVKSHARAEVLEARIRDLEAQLAVALNGQPYRAGGNSDV